MHVFLSGQIRRVCTCSRFLFTPPSLTTAVDRRWPIPECRWKPEDTFDATALVHDWINVAIKERKLEQARREGKTFILLDEAIGFGPWEDDES